MCWLFRDRYVLQQLCSPLPAPRTSLLAPSGTHGDFYQQAKKGGKAERRRRPAPLVAPTGPLLPSQQGSLSIELYKYRAASCEPGWQTDLWKSKSVYHPPFLRPFWAKEALSCLTEGDPCRAEVTMTNTPIPGSSERLPPLGVVGAMPRGELLWEAAPQLSSENGGPQGPPYGPTRGAAQASWPLQRGRRPQQVATPPIPSEHPLPTQSSSLKKAGEQFSHLRSRK